MAISVIVTSPGFAQAAMGPFYCPNDHKVYLDLAFFEEMKNRFHAPGGPDGQHYKDALVWWVVARDLLVLALYVLLLTRLWRRPSSRNA